MCRSHGAAGWETGIWLNDAGWRICRGHGIQTSSEVFVSLLTCNLSVKRSRKRWISLQRSIKYHFFMNLFQISWTKTSTWKCFYVCCFSQKSVPPTEAPEHSPSLPKWNSLAGYVHFSKGSDGSEWNTNLSLKRHANYWALSPGKHQTCQLQLSFLPFSCLCCAAQSRARCEQFHMSSGYSSENVSVLSGWHLNPPGAELSTQVITQFIANLLFKPGVVASWHLTDCVHTIYKPDVTSFHCSESLISDFWFLIFEIKENW